METPITAACKRMAMLLETGYLPQSLCYDIRLLMQGSMAYEVLAEQVKPTKKTEVVEP